MTEGIPQLRLVSAPMKLQCITVEDAPDSGWLIITYYNSKYRYSWLTEGSSKVKLPTIRTDGKAEVGRVRTEKRRRKKIREEKESEERRCRCAKR